MNFDKAFVIGSKKVSETRLNRFFKKNKLSSTKIELWDAIYGKDVDIKQFQKNNYLPNNFKLKMPGSLGCLLSHVTLWQHCINDQKSKTVLIFEDDVIIKDNFEKLLSGINISELPKNWTMLRLSYKGLIGKSITKNIIKPSLIKKRGVNAGTWCYILNVKNANILIDKLLPYDNKKSMDVILRENINDLNIFFSKKNLAIHKENKYSPRKDFNLSKKSLFGLIKISFRKYLYH